MWLTMMMRYLIADNSGSELNKPLDIVQLCIIPLCVVHWWLESTCWISFSEKIVINSKNLIKKLEEIEARQLLAKDKENKNEKDN